MILEPREGSMVGILQTKLIYDISPYSSEYDLCAK